MPCRCRAGCCYLSKLGALLLVGLLLQLVVMVCGSAIQIATGYHRFELPLYVVDLLGLKMVGFFQLAALALFVHVLVNHKHLGQFVMVLYFLVSIVLPIAGFEHNLYRYGSDPGYVYSDMNGYGHFLGPWGWFNLYWSLAAVLLVVLSTLLWPRGQETAVAPPAAPGGEPIAGARPRWRWRRPLLAFAGTGAFIFYNTNVLNHYRTPAQTASSSSRSTTSAGTSATRTEPQPRVTDARVHFDIRPTSGPCG